MRLQGMRVAWECLKRTTLREGIHWRIGCQCLKVEEGEGNRLCWWDGEVLKGTMHLLICGHWFFHIHGHYSIRFRAQHPSLRSELRIYQLSSRRTSRNHGSFIRCYPDVEKTQLGERWLAKTRLKDRPVSPWPEPHDQLNTLIPICINVFGD